MLARTILAQMIDPLTDAGLLEYPAIALIIDGKVVNVNKTKFAHPKVSNEIRLRIRFYNWL